MQTIEMMQPTIREEPFTNADWAFSLSISGHRIWARLKDGQVTLLSALGTELNDWFPEVVEAVSGIRTTGETILEGELCLLDDAGRNNVERLRKRLLIRGPSPDGGRLTLCLTDMLFHDGSDVRRLPWQQRRKLLAELGIKEIPGLDLQRFMIGEGHWLHRQALALGRDSVHGRHMASSYVVGQTEHWVIIPCRRVDEWSMKGATS